MEWLVDHLAFWPDRVAVDECVRAYSVPGAMRAGFAYTIDTMKVVSDNVKGAIIPQCGHYTPEEYPEQFLQLVMPFLTQ